MPGLDDLYSPGDFDQLAADFNVSANQVSFEAQADLAGSESNFNQADQGSFGGDTKNAPVDYLGKAIGAAASTLNGTGKSPSVLPRITPRSPGTSRVKTASGNGPGAAKDIPETSYQQMLNMWTQRMKGLAGQ